MSAPSGLPTEPPSKPAVKTARRARHPLRNVLFAVLAALVVLGLGEGILRGGQDARDLRAAIVRLASGHSGSGTAHQSGGQRGAEATATAAAETQQLDVELNARLESLTPGRIATLSQFTLLDREGRPTAWGVGLVQLDVLKQVPIYPDHGSVESQINAALQENPGSKVYGYLLQGIPKGGAERQVANPKSGKNEDDVVLFEDIPPAPGSGRTNPVYVLIDLGTPNAYASYLPDLYGGVGASPTAEQFLAQIDGNSQAGTYIPLGAFELSPDEVPASAAWDQGVPSVVAALTNSHASSPAVYNTAAEAEAVLAQGLTKPIASNQIILNVGGLVFNG